MFVIIRPDGRTERISTGVGPVSERVQAAIGMCEYSDMGRGFTPNHCLPICTAQADGTDGDLTLWVAETTITSDAGLRNIPAALLAAQWGLPARVLSGPIVVTSSGSAVSAFVEDTRWLYVESLVKDITRALAGLPCKGNVDPAWPQAIRLAGAVLDASPRPIAADLRGDAAVTFLFSELGLPILADGGQ
jgi:hypothetical protein